MIHPAQPSGYEFEMIFRAIVQGFFFKHELKLINFKNRKIKELFPVNLPCYIWYIQQSTPFNPKTYTNIISFADLGLDALELDTSLGWNDRQQVGKPWTLGKTCGKKLENQENFEKAFWKGKLDTTFLGPCTCSGNLSRNSLIIPMWSKIVCYLYNRVPGFSKLLGLSYLDLFNFDLLIEEE